MTHPVMIFVHGAWNSPEYYDRVIAILEPLGYKCISIAMPSVGGSPAVASLDEDIQAIRDVVMGELEAGSDVIVNAHSWGGIPTNSALDGLSKAEREPQGKHGVVKLTFVASFVFPEGVCLEDAIGGPADWWEIRDGNVLPPKLAIPMLYHDLDVEDAEQWVSTLKPHSVAVFRDKTRSAAWRRIPSAYLVCEDDRILPVQGQDAMVADVKRLGGEMAVERVISSHSPHLVKPDVVAGFLRRAAGESL